MCSETLDTRDDVKPDDESLVDDVVTFLRKNFLQIVMYRGNAAIRDIDPDTGEVWIQLLGACRGCGISPMTSQAIQRNLPMDTDRIEQVHIEVL
jgi:Fe-S cluster biogenesis protein NfuA